MAILFTRRVRKNDPPAMGASCQEGWWLTPLADLFPALRSGADGLQSADASIRFKQWGPNI
ncbi:MAG: hypothetical protein WCE88_08230, partial [Burkholderiales bacterium]